MLRQRHAGTLRLLPDQPLRLVRDLGDGLLAARVEHPPPVVGERGRDLQQQRRLADAWLAAQQDEAAGDQAAAHDHVELGEGWGGGGGE